LLSCGFAAPREAGSRILVGYSREEVSSAASIEQRLRAEQVASIPGRRGRTRVFIGRLTRSRGA